MKVDPSRSLWRREGYRMEPSVVIAALALAVDLFRTVFDIVWEVHKEKKHDKKEK